MRSFNRPARWSLYLLSQLGASITEKLTGKGLTIDAGKYGPKTLKNQNVTVYLKKAYISYTMVRGIKYMSKETVTRIYLLQPG